MRSDFSEDAARAFGRRRDNDMPAPFQGASQRSAGGAGGPRTAHYDTSAFGNRSGGSSVFTDEAASAFGKRQHKKRDTSSNTNTAPPPRSDSFGAHLAALGIDATDTKEWKQSALRRPQPSATAAGSATHTAGEMFPTLGTPTAGTPTAGTPTTIPKSESKGSFKDILKKRVELDEIESAKQREDDAEKKRTLVAMQEAISRSITARIRTHGNRIMTGAPEDDAGEPYEEEEDEDVLASYVKPRRAEVRGEISDDCYAEGGDGGEEEETITFG